MHTDQQQTLLQQVLLLAESLFEHGARLERESVVYQSEFCWGQVWIATNGLIVEYCSELDHAKVYLDFVALQQAWQ